MEESEQICHHHHHPETNLQCTGNVSKCFKLLKFYSSLLLSIQPILTGRLTLKMLFESSASTQWNRSMESFRIHEILVWTPLN